MLNSWRPVTETMKIIMIEMKKFFFYYFSDLVKKICNIRVILSIGLVSIFLKHPIKYQHKCLPTSLASLMYLIYSINCLTSMKKYTKYTVNHRWKTTTNIQYIYLYLFRNPLKLSRKVSFTYVVILILYPGAREGTPVSQKLSVSSAHFRK